MRVEKIQWDWIGRVHIVGRVMKIVNPSYQVYFCYGTEAYSGLEIYRWMYKKQIMLLIAQVLEVQRVSWFMVLKDSDSYGSCKEFKIFLGYGYIATIENREQRNQLIASSRQENCSHLEDKVDLLEACNNILRGQICDTKKKKLRNVNIDVKKVKNSFLRGVKLTLVLAMEEHLVVVIC